MDMPDTPIHAHTPFEDAQAIFAGTLFVSLALILFGQVGMLTGGTAVAISLLAAMMEWSPQLFAIERLHPAYAAVLGGLLLGSGCLFLARHHASLGGATIVTLYLQKAHGWRAGKVQMGIDCSIVLLALTVVEPARVGYSVLGAVVMNLFIWINHKPGRYAVL
jgi:uncharacterized membrane-anchored protein YitT (DUF2179 family)